MADNGSFDGDHHNHQLGGTGGSFSELLFSDDIVGLEMDGNLNYSSSSFSTPNTPKMLCFGSYKEREGGGGGGGGYADGIVRTVEQKSRVVTCSDSSSPSSSCNYTINSSKSNKRRNGSVQEPVNHSSNVAGAPVETQGNCKKSRNDQNPTSTGHAKIKQTNRTGRKEKLGERIIPLQQLVSPFGKTDTASVLHEAMGYIKFLHDQVQVLCSPYLQRLPSSAADHHHHYTEGGENGEGEGRKDLRSRGLCLAPVDCTVHVAGSNGADFWSPAMANTNNRSSRNSSVSKH